MNRKDFDIQTHETDFHFPLCVAIFFIFFNVDVILIIEFILISILYIISHCLNVFGAYLFPSRFEKLWKSNLEKI